MEEIEFDDVEAIRAKIGDEFGAFGGEVEVSQEMIDRFAELTGDHQWIHVDVERCKKESPFRTTIAHGFLTLSLLPRMGGRSEREPEWTLVGHGNVVNYGSDKIRFLAPVPSGSVLHSHSRLVDVEAAPKGTRLVREIAVHVVGSDRPALLYHMIVLYQAPRA
jgi:acyl dehydratase